MKIALDAMGNDASATPLVEGAILASKRFHDCEILLCGKQHSLGRLLRYFRYTGDRLHIVPCSEVVHMGESPRESLLKKDSPIAVGVRLVKEGKADAVVSVGNTGSSLAHCMRSWKRLPGIKRPGIAVLMPSDVDPYLVVDIGANVDCKAQHLLGFAVMGSVYMEHIVGRKKPRIGLLCVGEERSKGNALTLETFDLLEKSHLNFIGNIEPSDVLMGKVDILVCDGFVGNIYLKTSEAIAKMVMGGLKGAIKKNVLSLAGGLMVKPGMREFRKKVDHTEYGGAQLLGLEHVCVIGHGSSNTNAVMNAIRVAHEFVERKTNDRIIEELKSVDMEVHDA
jgi:phosphate acyltransferase